MVSYYFDLSSSFSILQWSVVHYLKLTNVLVCSILHSFSFRRDALLQYTGKQNSQIFSFNHHQSDQFTAPAGTGATWLMSVPDPLQHLLPSTSSFVRTLLARHDRLGHRRDLCQIYVSALTSKMFRPYSEPYSSCLSCLK